MAKVLITGAGGFIGNSVAALAANHPEWQVYALASGRREVEFPDGINKVIADLRDSDQTETLIESIKPDILIHFAWNLEKKGFLQSESNLQWLEISLRLMRAFQRHGGRQFLFAGSSSEYGYEQQVCQEQGVSKPTDLYGMCKLSFTMTAQLFCELNDITFTDIRYFPVYGPGENNLVHAIPNAIAAMENEEMFVCKAPNNMWDYIHIDDAAKATIQIADARFHGTVNVGSGQPVKMKKIFEILADCLGKKSLLRCENEQHDGKKLSADIIVLQDVIGFTPQISIEKGLAETVAWWKNNA